MFQCTIIKLSADTECYCVCCEGLRTEILRGTDSECYSVYCEGLAEGNIERK